jgi:hypothetical protein
MTHSHDNPHCELFDTLDWDESDIRDLIPTTPLRFDDDGQPAGYDAEQLFGLEATDLLGRFR